MVFGFSLFRVSVMGETLLCVAVQLQHIFLELSAFNDDRSLVLYDVSNTIDE